MSKTSTPRIPPLSRTLPGLAVMAVVVYVILFSGVPHFNEKDVLKTLANLSSLISDESHSRGQEIKLQYGKITLNGIAYEKTANIEPLSLDVIRQLWQGSSQRLTFSTAKAVLVPDNAEKNRVILRVNDVINLVSGSDLIATLTPSQPLTYNQISAPTASQYQYTHKFFIPGVWQIQGPELAAATVKFTTPLLAQLCYSPNKSIQTKLNSGEIRLHTKSNDWYIKSLSSHFASTLTNPETIETKGTLIIDSMSLTQDRITTPPLLFTAAFNVVEHKAIGGSVESMEVEIEKSILTDDTIKIATNGRLIFDINDVRSYGEIILEVNDISKFIESSWVREDQRTKAINLVDEIFDVSAKVRKQAVINFHRTKGGEWMVGKVKLTTLLDQGFLQLFTIDGLNYEQNNSKKNTPAS